MDLDYSYMNESITFRFTSNNLYSYKKYVRYGMLGLALQEKKE